jgi:hypothetical protein
VHLREYYNDQQDDLRRALQRVGRCDRDTKFCREETTLKTWMKVRDDNVNMGLKETVWLGVSCTWQDCLRAPVNCTWQDCLRDPVNCTWQDCVRAPVNSVIYIWVPLSGTYWATEQMLALWTYDFARLVCVQSAFAFESRRPDHSAWPRFVCGSWLWRRVVLYITSNFTARSVSTSTIFPKFSLVFLTLLGK